METDTMEAIALLFKKMKFRRAVIGGVSEADVWRKLEEVQNEYRRLYELQAAGYEARLKERDEKIAMLEERFASKEKNPHVQDEEESLKKEDS